MNTILGVPAMEEYIRMCNDGVRQGWHERNGGNLTYRMTKEDVEECAPYLKPESERGDWVPIGVKAENLTGEHFISTGSGKFLSNVSLEPQNSICIVEINAEGDAYRIVWGLEKGGRPTSEFPTHFMSHSVRKRVTEGSNRVIYHAHTPSLIALTFVLPLTAKAFTKALWTSATECPVVFPGGVGVVPWMVPGGTEIAVATCKLMEKYDAVVWTHHGLFVSGATFDNAFGLMHTIEKAADIHIRALSCGQGIRQTITDDDLRAIGKAFGVTLNKEFLD